MEQVTIMRNRIKIILSLCSFKAMIYVLNKIGVETDKSDIVEFAL